MLTSPGRHLFLLVIALVVGSSRPALTERVYSAGPGITPPQKITPCDPTIPEELKHLRIVQPRFVYEVVISSAGRVVQLKLVGANRKGYPYDKIEKAFRTALRNCAYQPAAKDGKPVAFRFNIVATVEVR